MSKKLIFQILFYTPLLAGVISVVLAFSLFDNFDFYAAFGIAFKCFALPVLLYMIPVCYFSYNLFLSDANPGWKDQKAFAIFFVTGGLSVLLIPAAAAFIILLNAWTGEPKTIYLNGTVASYYRKYKTNDYYVTVYDPQFKENIPYKVYRKYKVGDPFKKTMKIGSFGILYSER